MNCTDYNDIFMKKVIPTLEGSPNYIDNDGQIDIKMIKEVVRTAKEILNEGGSESMAKSSILAMLIINLKKCDNLPMELYHNVTKDAFMVANMIIDAFASSIEMEKVISLVARTLESKGYRFTSLPATNTIIETKATAPLRSILKKKSTKILESSDNESTTVKTHMYPSIKSVRVNDEKETESTLSFRDAIISTVHSDDIISIKTISSAEDDRKNSCLSFTDAIISTVHSDDLATIDTTPCSSDEGEISISSDDDFYYLR